MGAVTPGAQAPAVTAGAQAPAVSVEVVGMLVELVEQMAALAVLQQVRIAQRAASVVEVEVMGHYPTWVEGRGSTYRSPHTSTLAMEEILMWCGREEISPASSPVAAF